MAVCWTNPSIWVGIIGAAVGAILGFSGTYFLNKAQFRREKWHELQICAETVLLNIVRSLGRPDLRPENPAPYEIRNYETRRALDTALLLSRIYFKSTQEFSQKLDLLYHQAGSALYRPHSEEQRILAIDQAQLDTDSLRKELEELKMP